MTEEQEVIFRRQGYRPLTNAIWAKPFGNGMIIFSIPNQMIQFIFKSLTGKTSTWSREQLDLNETSDLGRSLRYFENWSVRAEFPLNGETFDWGFLTTEEALTYEL
jgi:hypothetical protein